MDSAAWNHGTAGRARMFVALVRRPGEKLDQDYRTIMEDLVPVVGQLIAIPPVAAFVPMLLSDYSPGAWKLGLLAASGSLFLAAIIWYLLKLRDMFVKRGKIRLGLFGERAVGDQLEILKTESYRVFHDVPCLGGGGPFNLNHVIVGRGGLAVIKTKTYRKPKEGAAKANCRVEFDGTQLIWPWGRSTGELEQVQRNADWLKAYLKKELAVDVKPMQVLSIPGWYVHTSKPGKVRVLNQKQLPKGINDLRGPLTAKEEELVVRRLASKCSDVTFQMVA